MVRAIGSLWQEDEGATMVEYGLALALIAIVALGAFTLLGQNVPKMAEAASAMLGG